MKKPNGSNRIPVDEDIHHCLFEYLTPQLGAPVIINLGSLIEIQPLYNTMQKIRGHHLLLRWSSHTFFFLFSVQRSPGMPLWNDYMGKDHKFSFTAGAFFFVWKTICSHFTVTAGVPPCRTTLAPLRLRSRIGISVSHRNRAPALSAYLPVVASRRW